MTKHKQDGQYLVVPDIHVPYSDPKFIGLMNKVLTLLPFKGMIQLGDFVDWWQLSTYDKSPDRKNTIGGDLEEYRDILEVWLDLLPDGADFHQLVGNHEDRLRRFVSKNAGPIYEAVKTIPEMLGLEELASETGVNIHYHPLEIWDSCIIGDAAFHHGVRFSKNIAMTNLETFPISICVGHTHRVQYVTDGNKWSITLGHGALADAISFEPVPKPHQQAFGIATVIKGHTTIEHFQVSEGMSVVRGQLIKGE